MVRTQPVNGKYSFHKELLNTYERLGTDEKDKDVNSMSLDFNKGNQFNLLTNTPDSISFLYLFQNDLNQLQYL